MEFDFSYMPTFQEASQITTSLPFIIFWIALWMMPLFFYAIWGSLTNARTSRGGILNSSVIQSANFWIAGLLFATISFIIILFGIFPFWLIPFE